MKNKLVVLVGMSIALFLLPACAASQKAQGSSFTGKVWVLIDLNEKPVISGSVITALFSTDGKVSGTSGCNRYTASYKTSDNKISISSPVASTLMMCEPGIMLQETSYINALGEAKTYKIGNNQLTLYGSSGAALAIYRAQSQELAGTTWQVLAYNNGKQAVTSVLNGTTMTAEFGQNGTISGNSGCNTYTGTYQLSGDQITIGPISSTKKYCDNPNGIMDQEMQYLAALQTASTYSIEGNTLEFRTKDGALAVQFTNNQ